MQSAHKYRIYPNKKQKELIDKHFGCTRKVYNYFLNEMKEHYKTTKKTLSYGDNCAALTILKTQKDFEYLNEVSNQALQNCLNDLNRAFQGFFKQLTDFPQWKKKIDSVQSYKVNCLNTRIKNNKLILAKVQQLGEIKISIDRDINKYYTNAKLNSCTISRNASGEYYASFQFEAKNKFLPKLDTSVGIDLGIKTLVVESNGKTHESPKFAKKAEKKKIFQQRKLAKKQKGSNNREKARIKLAKQQNKVKNQRRDFTHKLTRKIINENQVIIAENLKVKNMMANHKLAKAISDCNWGELTRQLKYKSEYYGRTYYEVDTYFASSKTCYNCGHKNDDLTLKDREWTCSSCNTLLDRDLNAAKNILKQGLADIAAGKHLVTKVAKSLNKRPKRKKKEKI